MDQGLHKSQVASAPWAPSNLSLLALVCRSFNDSTLPPEAFNRWLVQDYHFADTLTSFQAIAAAKTPHQSRKSLIAGLGALDAEMDWFEAQASARGLEFNAPVHEDCRRYCDFLIQAAYREP
jgi:formylaminopyrimidine deformylase / aminopyrimidine aminohydrolase